MAQSLKAGIRLEVDKTGNIRAFDLLRGDVKKLNEEARRSNAELQQLNRTARDAAASFNRFRSAIGQTVMYAGIAAGIAAVGAAMGKVIETGNKLQGLEASFTASFGSLASARQEMAYTKDLANELGLEVLALSEDYGKWAASVQGTALAGQQQKAIFESVAGAAKVLNLSADDTSGALRAMAQMVSKGKVQAEELRGQLGERLPGAFQIAARAMNVTTAELNKMLELGQVTAEDLLPKMAEEIKKTFGGDALEAAKQNFASNTNRMKNALTDLAAEVFTEVEPALSAIATGIEVAAKHEDFLIKSVELLTVLLAGKGVAVLASYTAGMASYTSGKLAAIAAARAQARAEMEEYKQQSLVASQRLATAKATAASAAASERNAAAAMASAKASMQAAVAERQAAALALVNAKGTDSYSAALQRSIAAMKVARVAETEYANSKRALSLATASSQTAIASQTAAIAAQTGVMAPAAAATGILATATRGLNSALMLVGGPAGAAVLAFGAAMVYREELMGLVTYSGQAASAEEDHAAAMDIAKASAYQYADASKTVRERLDEQKNAALNAARASIDEAKAAVDAARSKLSAAQALAAGGDNAVLSGVGSTDPEERQVTFAEKMLLQQQEALKELEERYNHFGESKQQLDKAFTETPPAAAAAATAISNVAAATGKAAKVTDEHGKTLQSLIESLTAQRIELEHGQAAAEYYTRRLNGLTDAEARAAAGADQYNTFLTERKKLQDAALQRSGDLEAIYRAQLENAGLGDISSQFDAIKESTDKAVSAAQAYKAALAATGEGGVASIGKITAQVNDLVAAFMKMGWSQAQAAGIVANLKRESSLNMSAVGDGGKAYGLGQWHPDRQANFASAFGHDIRSSSLAEQLQFVNYELTKGAEQRAGNLLRGATTPGQAGAIVSRYYERPQDKDGEASLRAKWAQEIALQTGKAAANTAQLSANAAEAGSQGTALVAATVKYAGEIDSARVSQQQINDLVAQYMQGQADDLIQKAEQHRLEIEMGAIAYRQMDLEAQKFNATQIQAITAAENAAMFAEIKQDLQDQYQQLTLTEEAYRRVQLGREGYTKAQQDAIVAAENEIEHLQEVRGAIDSLGDALSNTFEKAIETGKLKFDDLKDWLKQTFNKLVLSPIIQAVTAPIQGFMQSMLMPSSAASVVPGIAGAAGAASGAGGLGSLLSGGGLTGIKDMVFGNSIGSAFGNVGSTLGTNVFSGAAGYSNLAYGGAGLLGGLFGQAAFGGQGGVGGGLGATLGMAIGGPIGALAGGLLGGLVGGLFGGKKETTGQGIELSYSGGDFSGQNYTDWKKDGGWFSGTKRGTDYSAMDGEIISTINDYFDGVETALADQAEYFGVSAADSTIAAFNSGLQKLSLADKSEEEISQIVEDWANGIRDSMYDAVFGDEYDQFRQDGEDLAAMFDRLIFEIDSVNAFTQNLGLTFALTGKEAAVAADAMAQAAGGIQNLNALVETYYQNFYSDQERLLNVYRDGSAALAEFNAANDTLIDSRDGLRAFVDALDLTTGAGQEAFASAMQLAPALISMTDAQAALLSQTLDLRNALLEIQGGDLSILTPVEKLEDARARFEETYAQALAGNEEAIAALAGQGQALLQLSRAYNASGTGYTADYAAVTGALEGLAGSIEASIMAGMESAASTATPAVDVAAQVEDTARLFDLAAAAVSAFSDKLSTALDMAGLSSQVDGSHATGLPYVPFDGYRAELHKGEKVLDAGFVAQLNHYGFPINVQGGNASNDNQALVAEVRALRAEVAALRNDNNRHGSTAAAQRDQQARLQSEAIQQNRDQHRAQQRLKRVESN